ncbi:MAG: biotin--[acetyl-CoA-carboxylase] ligase [Akkermansiaceae bacterium]
MFDWQAFASFSPGWAEKTTYHREIDSTNNEALRLIGEGLHGTHVILADHQTAGKGRRGKSWDSEQGAGLLFSVSIPFQEETEVGQLALIAGLSLLRALAKHQITAQIKWPNDVIYQGRKCAGILIEAQQKMAVIGIGINVDSGVPLDLPDTASALPVNREQLLADVLSSLVETIAEARHGFAGLCDELRDACFLTGKTINFTQGNASLSGKVCGISDEGALVVDTGKGPQSFFQAADIICEK